MHSMALVSIVWRGLSECRKVVENKQKPKSGIRAGIVVKSGGGVISAEAVLTVDNRKPRKPRPAAPRYTDQVTK